MKSNKKYI